MTQGSGYGQFCPVAKAAEVLTTRWTPLILREMICGSSQFNEIHRGVPLMPRSLLSKRLKELQAAGIVERTRPDNAKNAGYRLTDAGNELGPIIISMGIWGQRWVESSLDGPDWDAGVLMWDMHRRIDTRLLGDIRTVLQFEYDDAPEEMRLWWLLIEAGDVDLCVSDPGFDVDLYVLTDVQTMARIWIGKDSLARALDAEDIILHGDADMRRKLSQVLRLSPIVDASKQPPRLKASTTVR